MVPGGFRVAVIETPERRHPRLSWGTSNSSWRWLSPVLADLSNNIRYPLPKVGVKRSPTP